MSARLVLSLCALSLIAGHALAQSRPVLADGSVRNVSASLVSGPARGSLDNGTDRIQDGTSSTILRGEDTRARTDATLGGIVTQLSTGGQQDLLVGAVRISGDGGSIETRAFSGARISQQQTRGSFDNVQTALVGTVIGRVGAVTRTDATLFGSLTQAQAGGGAGGAAAQNFALASTLDAGGTVTTSGTVGGDVSQSLSDSGRFVQDILVGSVAESTAGAIHTDALASGRLSQTAGRGNEGSQTIGIANARDVRSAQALELHGRAVGGIQQIRAADAAVASQEVRIGSADALQGAVRGTTQATVAGDVIQRTSGLTQTSNQQIGVARLSGELNGTVEANGSVDNSITQEIAGSGGSQFVEIGSVKGRASGTIHTSARQGGAISQHISGGDGSGSQAYHLGSVSGAKAVSITTDAVVEGRVSQVMTGSSRNAFQELTIASVRGVDAGRLEARAQVGGDITQILVGSPGGGARRGQQLSLGDISGTGTDLSTHVVVGGSIVQADGNAGGGTRVDQTIAVGSIGRL